MMWRTFSRANWRSGAKGEPLISSSGSRAASPISARVSMATLRFSGVRAALMASFLSRSTTGLFIQRRTASSTARPRSPFLPP